VRRRLIVSALAGAALLGVGLAAARAIDDSRTGATSDLRLSAIPQDSAHVRLRWRRIPHAASYSVKRASLVIAETPNTGYTDAQLWPQTRYVYTVTARSSTGEVLAQQRNVAVTSALPATGIAPILPSDSFWYQPIQNATPAANSANLEAYFVAHATNPSLTLHAWGVSVAEAHSGDPLYKVACTADWKCTLNALGRIPIPLTAQPDPEGDGHLAVYDPLAHREWDMWRAARTPTGWTAASGAAIRLTSGTRPSPVAGADAANFPLLGGLIRPEEILQGHIDHALVFGLSGIGPGPPVCPAAHNVATTNDANAPREGQLVQLDPTIDVNALAIPAWEKVIARAMQVYGMYLRDNSGSLAVYAENPISRNYDAWAKAGLPSGDSASLAGIPWDSVHFLAAPDWPHCG
jgi:hypothetical protein